MYLRILILVCECIFLLLKIIDISHLDDTLHNILLLEDLIDHQLEIILDLPAINSQKDTKQIDDLV